MTDRQAGLSVSPSFRSLRWIFMFICIGVIPPILFFPCLVILICPREIYITYRYLSPSTILHNSLAFILPNFISHPNSLTSTALINIMYNPKVLLSMAALTGASLAQSSSSAGDAECTRSYLSLVKGLPTPASELASAITSYATGVAQSGSATDTNPLAYVTDVCSFESQLPSSLQSDFSSYVTQVISYVSASSSQIDAVITNCVATGLEGAAYTSLVNSLATHTGPLCAVTGAPNGTTSGITSGTGISNSPTPTPTGSSTNVASSPTSSGSSASVSTDAAAKPTGIFAAAAAAAGLLGAVALL
ncbi:hypothetical protein HD806DRAFT_478973 [Xylariaceae sp. AK1471]|nr:hypothetical protein HD806DRAFT_478973 [Xylariaceae sp. AK1471]